MLVLTRKTGESVVMTIPASNKPRTIRLVMLRTPSEARLGIKADSDVNIVRSEVLRADREQALGSTPSRGN